MKVANECAACATREKHINKLKQDVARWKSRATTHKKQAEKLKAKSANSK